MPVTTSNNDPIEEEDEEEDGNDDDDDESVGHKQKRPRLSSSLKKATRQRHKGCVIRFNYTRPHS